MAIGTTAAILGAAAIGAGASIYSGSQQAGAIDSASAATAAAAAGAIAEQRRQFDLAQQNQKPWLVTGTSALNTLANMYGLDTYQPNWNAPPGGIDEAATKTQLMNALTANLGKGYDQAFVDQIKGMIDSGATLGAIQSTLGAWASSTTSPENQQAVAAILGSVTNPVQTSQAQQGTYTPGANTTTQLGTVQQPVAGTTTQPNVAPGAATTGTTPTTGIDPFATFYQSPDYQFRLGQGIQGLDASAAAQGTLDSGATRKAAIEYAGNVAAGEYNNYANRLAALAGVGQTTATNLGNLGQGYAATIGNTMVNQGNNMASSYLAKGQNYANTINNLAGIGQGLILNTAGGATGHLPGEWTATGAPGIPGGYQSPYNYSWA